MIEEFAQIAPGTIFRKGALPNSPDGLFMTDGGGMLWWIAVKGYNNDWAIYCHWILYSEEYIRKSGQKVGTERNILKCIPDCGDILKYYRA